MSKIKILPGRLSRMSFDELRYRYKRVCVIRYVNIAIGFLLFLIIGSVMLEIRDLIPTLEPALSFILSQTMITIFIFAVLLLAVESAIASRFRKIESILIDIMMKLEEKN